LIDYNIINNQTNLNFFTIFEATKEKKKTRNILVVCENIKGKYIYQKLR
jgi:hypothetical protein